jgi:hypothetical protein
MQAFADWVASTSLSAFVSGNEWVWPACETLHFIGLALLIGNVGLMDLRLLGVEKRLPVAGVSRFVRWAVLGFVINLITGIMFFAGNPYQYVSNIAFGWRIAFIALAGVNVLVFYAAGIVRQVESLEPGADAPIPAKIIAATSLFLWVAVMYMGRMLPYIGNSF